MAHVIVMEQLMTVLVIVVVMQYTIFVVYCALQILPQLTVLIIVMMILQMTVYRIVLVTGVVLLK